MDSTGTAISAAGVGSLDLFTRYDFATGRSACVIWEGVHNKQVFQVSGRAILGLSLALKIMVSSELHSAKQTGP